MLYLNSDRKRLIYCGYKFQQEKILRNDFIRWRCSSCKRATFNSKDNVPLIDVPLVHDIVKCIQMFPIEVQCCLAYEIIY